MSQSLSDAPLGKNVVIGAISSVRDARRLMELGFAPGGVVKRLFDAPFGDPRAYLVRDAIIALRNADAANVKLL